MDNIRVTQRTSTIRAIARDKLSNSWASISLAIILYVIILGWIPSLLDSIADAPLSITISDYYFYVGNVIVDGFNGNLTEFFPGILNPEIEISYWSILYLLLIVGVMAFGVCKLFLHFVRTKLMDYKLLFGGFKHYFKVTLLYIVVQLKILLWALFFIVPGIIAMINYSQAVLIMVDDPDKGIMQCIHESCQLMKGNKKKYFYLVLSYSGWFVLAIIAILVILVATILITGFVISSFVISVLEFIPLSFVFAYFQSGKIVFYETLVGNLIPMDDLYFESVRQKKQSLK